MVMFLSAVDSTIVGTAMPKVVAAIGGMHLYPWAFSAFMLTQTIATPFFGRFADLYGVRRCMYVAIALFLLGSGLCGAARSMEALVAFRALQGLGAGGTATLVFISFGLLFPPESRGRAQGLLSMVWGVSSLLGPLAGGLMVDHFPWPWIFWVNLPVGAIAVAMIRAGLPRREGPTRPHALDPLGAALLVVGLVGVMVALEGRSWWLAALGAVGALALAGFGWRQTKVAEPLLPLGMFSTRLFAVSAALGFVSCLTMFAALSYVPLYAQGVLGASARDAGLALTPMMVGWPLAGAAAGWVLNRTGYTPLVLGGAALMTLGFGLLAWPGLASDLVRLGGFSALLGLGMGLLTSTTLVAAQTAVPRREIGAASAALALARNVGGALGLNLLGGIQLAALASGLEVASGGLSEAERALLANPQAVLEPSTRATLDPAVFRTFSEALGGSLQLVYAVSLGVALLCLVIAWWMPARGPAREAAPVAGAEAQ
jgi:EmrB/QacA subfamily drug resistance transporter